MKSNYLQGKRSGVTAIALILFVTIVMSAGVAVPAYAQTVAFPAPTTFA
jgi:hypothetical protein